MCVCVYKILILGAEGRAVCAKPLTVALTANLEGRKCYIYICIYLHIFTHIYIYIYIYMYI